MKSKIGIVIGREFMERVHKKSFIVTTLLMPVFMLLMMVAPALIMTMSGSDERNILVVDQSGIIAPELRNTESTKYTAVNMELDSAIARTDVFGVLFIPADVDSESGSVKLYTNGASSMSLESDITDNIDKIIESHRLKSYNIENLDRIMDKIHSNVRLQSVRNDKEEGSNQSSAILSYILGFVLTFLLYMCLLL